MPEGEITNEILAKKIDDVYLFLNQLAVFLQASGGVMNGTPPMAQSLPPYQDPYEVGGTGEQKLPNLYGYRE